MDVETLKLEVKDLKDNIEVITSCRTANGNLNPIPYHALVDELLSDGSDLKNIAMAKGYTNGIDFLRELGYNFNDNNELMYHNEISAEILRYFDAYNEQVKEKQRKARYRFTSSVNSSYRPLPTFESSAPSRVPYGTSDILPVRPEVPLYVTSSESASTLNTASDELPRPHIRKRFTWKRGEPRPQWQRQNPPFDPNNVTPLEFDSYGNLLNERNQLVLPPANDVQHFTGSPVPPPLPTSFRDANQTLRKVMLNTQKKQFKNLLKEYNDKEKRDSSSVWRK